MNIALAGRTRAELREHAARLVRERVPRALAIAELRREGWRCDLCQIEYTAARRRLRVCPACGRATSLEAD